MKKRIRLWLVVDVRGRYDSLCFFTTRTEARHFASLWSKNDICGPYGVVALEGRLKKPKTGGSRVSRGSPAS